MRISWMIGVVLSVSLGLLALWLWGQSADLSDGATRPDVLEWGIRLGAVAAGAAAQAVIFGLVVGAFYRRNGLDHLLRLFSALVCSIALVSAAALALAGR